MANHQRINVAAASSEPVAGTSLGTTETTNVTSTKTGNQNDKGIVKGAGSGERGQVGNQNGPSKSLSKAQINVVKTMVYITV